MTDNVSAPRLVLASASPRRRELLDTMGIAHDVLPSNVDESKISADHPRTFALRAAYAKAKDVVERVEEGRWVLASDTVVAVGLILLGKPADSSQAEWMLRKLSGKTHDVITAIAVARAGAPELHLRSVTTRVTFRTIDDAEICAYLATDEPYDKAGAYGIQGAAAEFIERIDGDYFTVMGLPCKAVRDLLAEVCPEFTCTLPTPPARWKSR